MSSRSQRSDRIKKTFGMAAVVALLSAALSVSGLPQGAVAAARAGVQKVLITNRQLSVNVANSPSVTVSNSPSVKIDSSANTVQSLPGAPGQPVQFGATVAVPTGSTGVEKANAYTVPAGKILVIEFVSVHYAQQDSSQFVQAAFSTGSGPRFFVGLQNQAATGRGGYDFDEVGSEQTRVYAKAGEAVTVYAPHDIQFTATTVDFAFSGFLVNA